MWKLACRALQNDLNQHSKSLDWFRPLLWSWLTILPIPTLTLGQSHPIIQIKLGSPTHSCSHSWPIPPITLFTRNHSYKFHPFSWPLAPIPCRHSWPTLRIFSVTLAETHPLPKVMFEQSHQTTQLPLIICPYTGRINSSILMQTRLEDRSCYLCRQMWSIKVYKLVNGCCWLLVDIFCLFLLPAFPRLSTYCLFC